MTTEVQNCVNHKKWAKANLESMTKKFAFLDNLKANINNLTKDVKVGTRFVSTKDYDGNLYECKLSEHAVVIQKPIYMNSWIDGEMERRLYHQEKEVPFTKVNLTKLLYSDKDTRFMFGNTYMPYDSDLEDMYETEARQMKVVLDKSFTQNEVLDAKNVLGRKKYYERIHQEDEPESIYDIEFQVLSYEVEVSRTTLNGEERRWMTIWGEGYFPEIQTLTNRIWVRKCNIVAEACGKNVDSSRKSINFTLKKMDVRKMLGDEIEKLKKIRKIFNESNPPRARSATLKQLTEEQKRLEPTLKRLEALYDDLCDVSVCADAYYCKKYGYLIPFRAKIVLEVSGETFEKQLEEKNKQTKANIEQQIEKKNELMSEIVPAVLHPDRVEKEIEKYGIDGVFGDDIDVVKNGVVNKSVFG